MQGFLRPISFKNTAFSGQGGGRNGTDGLMFSAEAFQQQNRQLRRWVSSHYRKDKEEITSLACERDRCREDPTGWLLKILPNMRLCYNHSNILALAPILQASQHSFFTLRQGCYENWDIPSPPPTQPIGLRGVNKMAFLLRTLISQGISNLNHSYTLFLPLGSEVFNLVWLYRWGIPGLPVHLPGLCLNHL